MPGSTFTEVAGLQDPVPCKIEETPILLKWDAWLFSFIYLVDILLWKLSSFCKNECFLVCWYTNPGPICLGYSASVKIEQT